ISKRTSSIRFLLSSLCSVAATLGWSLPRLCDGSVPVLGRYSRLLPNEDKDVSEELRCLFEDEGIELILNWSTKRISGKSGGCVRVRQRSPKNVGGQPSFDCDRPLS